MANGFDFANIGQMFGPGMGATPTGIDALLNEEQRRLLGRNAALSAAAALLQAGAPSRTPVNLGQALGSALQAGQAGYQQARAGALQDLLLREKLREAQRLGQYQAALSGQPPVAAPAEAAAPLNAAQASLLSQTAPVSTAGPVGPTLQRAAIMDAAQVAPPPPAEMSATERRFQELMRKADIANQFNKPEDAQKFLDQAFKIKPPEEFSTSLQYGTSAQGTPISFVLSKSGGMKLMDVQRNPEFSYQDTGSYISVRDKNTNRELERIPKSMTPGEVASNRIAMGNLRVAQGNLALRGQEVARGAYEVRETPDGLAYVPKVPGGAAVPVTTAEGTRLQGAGAKPTEDQSKSAGFAFRMTQASEIFNQPVTNRAGQPVLDPQTGQPITLEQAFGKPSRYQAIMRSVPMVGTGIANISEDPNRQLYRQAQENWVSANLRAESGAVLGLEEIDKEIVKYFPQPSDSDEVIRQKAKARRDTELAMRVRAGPAYKQVQQQSSVSPATQPASRQPTQQMQGVPVWDPVKRQFVYQ